MNKVYREIMILHVSLICITKLQDKKNESPRYNSIAFFAISHSIQFAFQSSIASGSKFLNCT